MAKRGFVEEERFQETGISVQGGDREEGLGENRLAHGTWKKSISEGVFLQLGQNERPDVLCQGEMSPFWGKGHFPTFGAKTSRRLCRI